MEKVRTELEAMEREKKKTNLGDNQRGRKNWAEKLGNQRLDKKKWGRNKQHGWPILWVVKIFRMRKLKRKIVL